MSTISKIKSVALKSLFSLFAVAAFAWPFVAQADYEHYTKQGVMGYYVSGTTVDVVGYYQGAWTKCTYGNYGYQIQGSYNLPNCTIVAAPEFKSGGKYVQMAWRVTNNGSTPLLNTSFGVWCDSMIGPNDSSGIEVMRTGRGVIKGLKMIQDRSGWSSYNAQLNLFFKDTAGVTDYKTYWFGRYSNQDKWNYQLNADYARSSYPSNYVINENDEVVKFYNADSALAFSWAVDLQPGETKTYSFLLGIGERADPPEWYYDTTKGQELDDALGLRANGRSLTSIGKATDVTTSGNILMYVMSTPNKFGSAGETNLATVAAQGKTTPVTLAGDIDTTGWAKGLYILDYWLVNDKGAMSADSIRKPIQIMEDGTLNADPGDETTYLVEGSCVNSESFTNFTIRVFGIGQDPDNIGVATTNDFDAVIDSKGVFYSLLPDGHYNVVITGWSKDTGKPVTTTSLVDVLGAGSTLSVILPTKPVDSIIDDKATKFNGTVCGGLDDMGRVLVEKPGVTNVHVQLDVVDKDESAQHAPELAEAAIGDDPTRQCDFVDLSVWTATNFVTNAVHKTTDLLKIGLPFPDPKHCFVKVHRWHDNQVQQILEGAENANEEGEYFEIFQEDVIGEAVQDEVLLHVKNFSLYCISRGKEYATVRLYQPEHGTVELSLEADFSTTIGDKFKPVWTETNVFVRCVANEGWIFQGFDASGLKANDHLTLSQKRDFTYDTGSGNWYWVPKFKFKPTPAFSNATRKVVFDTLEELIADPWTQDGDTVMLTRDITIESPLKFTRSLVFDGEGRTLKVGTPYVKDDGSLAPTPFDGGILSVIPGVTVTVTNALIEGGRGEYAVVNNGSLTLDDVTIKNSNGGVRNASGAKLLVRNSRIGHNVAENGAAIANAGKAVLVNSSFDENRATGIGGALYNTDSSAKFYVNNVVFGNNSACTFGGAAAFVSGAAYFQNTTFAGNITTNTAAAVAVGSAATVKIANSVLANNFRYDTSTDTATADDIAAETGATVELRGCVYTALTGLTPVGGTVAAEDDLFASYAPGKRLFGNDGCTAQTIANLPVFSKKHADEALSLYAPISDSAPAAYRTAGVDSTTFGVDADLNVTLKGTDYTYADECTGAAVELKYYEEIGIRVANLPGASGTTTPVTSFVLRLKSSPANGTVSGVTLYGDAYQYGDSVTVSATADAGYYFLGWYEDDESTLITNDAVYTLTMPAAHKTIAARFGALVPESAIWVNQASWIAGEEEAPAHTYGGKLGTGVDEFEYAPKKNTSFWAIEKPVNVGSYYIKYIVREAPPYAESVVTNEFIVGGWVTFDAAGGSFGNDALTTDVLCPGNYVLPANPTRPGYQFLGWYDSAAVTAAEVAEGDELTVDHVFAHWKSVEIVNDTPVVSGGITADGLAVTNAKPTVAYFDGNVAIPERGDNSEDGPAIVSIAPFAFMPTQYRDPLGAPEITSVSIPVLVTEIGRNAFYENEALTNLTLSPVYNYRTGEPETLLIRNMAFARTAITNLVFPAGGSYELEWNSFSQLPNLKNVYIYGDVKLASLSKSPFREVGEAVGGTVFHLSPAKFADAEYVRALTNGLHMVQIRAIEPVSAVSNVPLHSVAPLSFGIGSDEITAHFKLPSGTSLKVSNETVTLLYSCRLAEVVAGDAARLPATSVTSLGDDEWTATFAKPEGDTGFFLICIGE